MESPKGESPLRAEAPLRQFFRSKLSSWTEFYSREDIYARIYQERRATAIQYADELKLPPGSLILDVGCGPGFVSVPLAQKNYRVHALDFLQEMAAAARDFGRESGKGENVRPTVADATLLPFPDCAFDLVVMLGVTEWVSPLTALVSEAARVLKPGGFFIVAWNNRWGLHMLIDPVANPLLGSLRKSIRGFLEKQGWIASRPPGYLYSNRTMEAACRNHNLKSLHARGVGFGPFSMLGRNIVPERSGHRLNSGLQRLADAGAPLLHSMARNSVLVARKMGTITRECR